MKKILKISILIFLILGFLTIPNSFVFAQMGDEGGGSTLSSYIDALRNGVSSGQDTMLQTADMYLQANPTIVTDADRQAYEAARNTYLDNRRTAIGNGSYDPIYDGSDKGADYARAQGLIKWGNDRQAALQELLNNNSTDTLLQDAINGISDPALKTKLQNLFGKDSEGHPVTAFNNMTLGGAQGEIGKDTALSNKVAKGIIQDKKRAMAQESAACLYKWGVHPMNCVLQMFAAVGTVITGVAGTLLWVAGHLFDLSVYMSITTMNDWLSNTGIAKAWGILRDLANICFIFILLYIAIGTVFELSGVTGNVQKLIVNVVIVALLVNFSGFFTRVVIDASNIIAYEFYSKMGGSTEGGATLEGIGWKFVEKLDLTRYYVDTRGSNLETPQINRLSFFGIIIQTFGNVILILAATFVLLAASIMFLIRTIVLIFVYIFSPIAVVSMVIPSNKFNYFDKWKDRLISQAFFAPAFLIPLYVVFVILGDGIGTLAGANGNTAGSMIGGGSAVIIIMDFLLIGLTLGCIFVANSMGAAGAKLATAAAGAGTLAGVKGIRATYNNRKKGPNLSNWAATNATSTNPLRRIGAAPIRGADFLIGGASSAGSYAAGTRAGTAVRGAYSGASAAAKSAWDSKAGKAFQASDFGKKVVGAAKNPLLAANDAIIAAKAAMDSGGGGSFSILGSTSAERSDAKKKEKEESEKERIKSFNDRLSSTIATEMARPPATPLSQYNALEPIIEGMSEDDLKIVDLKIFADNPIAALALPLKHLQKLSNRKDKLADDGPHKAAIHVHITNEALRHSAGCHNISNPGEVRRKQEYNYMNTTGRISWA